jgi:hypothetical protein
VWTLLGGISSLIAVKIFYVMWRVRQFTNYIVVHVIWTVSTVLFKMYLIFLWPTSPSCFMAQVTSPLGGPASLD